MEMEALNLKYETLLQSQRSVVFDYFPSSSTTPPPPSLTSLPYGGGGSSSSHSPTYHHHHHHHHLLPPSLLTNSSSSHHHHHHHLLTNSGGAAFGGSSSSSPSSSTLELIMRSLDQEEDDLMMSSTSTFGDGNIGSSSSSSIPTTTCSSSSPSSQSAEVSSASKTSPNLIQDLSNERLEETMLDPVVTSSNPVTSTSISLLTPLVISSPGETPTGNNNNSQEDSNALSLLTSLGGHQHQQPVTTAAPTTTTYTHLDLDAQRFINEALNEESGGKGGRLGFGGATATILGNVLIHIQVPQKMRQSGSNGRNNGKIARPHLCSICDASYKTKTHLRRHRMVHLNDRPFLCCMCGKGFNRREHLNKHQESVHSGTKHTCPFCSKEISRRDHLTRHIKNMHPDYAEQLKESGIDELDSKAILRLISQGILPTSTIQPTSDSGKRKRSGSASRPKRRSKSAKANASSKPRSAKKTYETSHHDKNSEEKDPEERGIQEVDSSSFPQKESQGETQHSDQDNQQNQEGCRKSCDVSAHSEIEEPMSSSSAAALPDNSTSEDDNSFTAKCTAEQLCRAEFYEQDGLLGLTALSLTLGGQVKEPPFLHCSDPKRFLSSLESPSLLLPCADCTLIFTSEKELVSHQRMHKPQNFRCAECPRAYTRREKLTEHMRCFHQGQKFKCEHCGKELSRRDHVLRHVRSIHPEILACQFSMLGDTPDDLCDLDVTTPLPVDINEHEPACMQSSSHVNTSAEDEQVPTTTYANKSSTTITTTSASSPKSKTISVVKQPGVGDMSVLLRGVCHHCLKVFGTSYHLARHIESCHNGGARPYICLSCTKQFKRKDHLTKHIKSHCSASIIRDAVSSLQHSPSP